MCAASVGYPSEWRRITTASYIREDFCKVNICVQRSSLQETGRHVSGASSLLLSSSSGGTYGLICPSPGFGYSRHCMARRLINSRMLSLYVSL